MKTSPMLFNTEMVQAILVGQKKQTRRVIDTRGHEVIKFGAYVKGEDPTYAVEIDNHRIITSRYQPGDVLYVRETWAAVGYKAPGKAVPIDWKSIGFIYRADAVMNSDGSPIRWRPSIHMPKLAARIFLKVKSVRAERLNSITTEDLIAEGTPWEYGAVGDAIGHMRADAILRGRFKSIWNGTLQPSEIRRVGWDANPWVWAYTFEPCGRPEGWPSL